MIKKNIQLAFDLDTNKLKEVYSTQTGKNYNNAYNVIRRFLEKREYQHCQGTVYHSNIGKTRADIITDLKLLQEENSWFGQCVNKIDYGEISELHDLLPEINNRAKEIQTKELKQSPEQIGEKFLQNIFDNDNSLSVDYKEKNIFDR